MLSIENPPESSSSPNKAQSYLRTVDDSQKHSFSIRDYVFSSRSKDIKSSWPFPQQSLQFCLKNGIKDILPPFEPPDLIRSQLSTKEVEQISSQAVGPPDKEPDSLNCDSSLSPSRDKAKPAIGLDLLDAETQTHSRVTSPDYSAKSLSHITELPSSVHVINTSEASSDIGVAKSPVRHEKPTKKKCPLIVRLSTIPENRVEDLSSISIVSDPMASNVCPVCKTFSSSSNTTLNAHIDQCLAEESNAKRIITAKLKVKPRKKRLMVDIYTTAPVCTLEDLDRRNGTKWAAELAVLNASVAPESNLVARAIMESQDGNNVAKRPKFSPEDDNETRDDGDETAVYVDSNGVKLRILSKFGNQPTISKKDFKLKKHAKNLKTGKCPVLGKKKHFGQNYSKHMMKHIKMKQQSKKSAMLKLSQGQVQEAVGGELQSADRQGTEEFESGFTDPDTQVRVCTSLTKWVCSKRSVLKKHKNKVNEMPRENLLRRTTSALIENKTRSTSVENNQVDSHNIPVLRSHALKFSRSPGDLTASSKTKKKDVFSSTDSYVGSKASSSWRSECSSSANRLLLKLSRSTGKVISSPKSKNEEMRRETTRRPSDISQPLEEDRDIIIEKNVFAGGPSLSAKTNNADEKEIHVINANIWKHRSKKGRKPLKYNAQGSLNVSRSSRRLRPCNSEEPEVTNIVEAELEREDELPEPLTTHDRETEEAMELAVSTHNFVDNQISEKIKLCDREVQTEADTENSIDEQELQGHNSGDNEYRRKDDYCLVEEDEIHGGIISGEASITSSLSRGDAENNPQENSSVTSTGPVRSQDCNLATHTVTSSSPISSAAISSPATPNDHELSHRPPRDLCSKISTVDTLAMQPPRSTDQLVNVHPCCCSRREAIHRDFHFFQPCEPNITPVRSGSSNSLSSSSRADTIPMAVSSLDLHADPTTTKIPSKSSYEYPSFIDFTSPSPSPRTQMLRLMGKTLMVDKEQQSMQPPPVCGNSMQIPEHHVLERSLSESLYNGSINQPYWRTDLKFSHTPKDVILIGDSPDHEAGPLRSTLISPSTSATINRNNTSNIGLQRSISCFPLPSQYLARDFSSHNSRTPAFSISCPRTNSTLRGTTSEAPPPILPRPFPFPSSTARVAPHLYYSHS